MRWVSLVEAHSPLDDGTRPEVTDAHGAHHPKPDIRTMLALASKKMLRDDWSCVRGPPDAAPQLPGVRYGASLPMKPVLVTLPCPCAGGVAGDGVSVTENVWSVLANSLSRLSGTHTQADTASTADPYAESSPLSALASGVMERSRAGTEPYAADYGCASGQSQPLGDGPKPGLRWRSHLPADARLPVLVATPCPCWLEALTGRAAPEPDVGSGEKDVTPQWQAAGGGSMMLSSMPDAVTAVLACGPRREMEMGRHARMLAFV